MSMKHVLLGDDPWSEELKNTVRESPHYRTVLLWLQQGVDVPMEATPYWEFMAQVAWTNSWGTIIKNVQDAHNQYERFKNLYKAYPNWNVDKDTVKIIGGVRHYYGGIMVKVADDGKLVLWDGNHRIAILLALNAPIEVVLCERTPTWQKMLDDLVKLYPSFLYQPILHPEFKDWKVTTWSVKEAILRSILIEHEIKSVLEIGSCHGHLLYTVRDLLVSVTGVEMEPTRFYVTYLLYKHLGFLAWRGNAVDFFESNEGVWDCCLALAVFHHISRWTPIDKFVSFLLKIKQRTKILIYELPEENEEQYSWLYAGVDMHKLLRVFWKTSVEYPIGRRKIVVLKD